MDWPSGLTSAMMNNYLNLHDQYLHGACPKHLWLRTIQELKAIYDQSPGLKKFRETDPGFEDVFGYVDQMSESDYGELQGFHDVRRGED